MNCKKCKIKMINVPLRRVEHQKLLTIKRWSEFEWTCYKCGHREPKTIVPDSPVNNQDRRILLITIGIIVLVIIVLSSCSRQVSKNIAKGSSSNDTELKTSDTTRTDSTVTTDKTTRYGDTVTGGLYFDDFTPADSFESEGIKINATYTKAANGAVKVKVTAKAKPVETKERTVTTVSTQAGKSTTEKVKKDSTYTARVVDKKSKVSSTGFIATSIIIFLIIAVIAYLYKRYKKYLPI